MTANDVSSLPWVVQAAMVAVAYGSLNWIWPRYLSAIAGGRATSAAGWDMALVVLSGASTVLYVRDPWLLGVAVVSAGIGCWVSVRWKAREH